MSDIEDRADVEQLINHFYERVFQDDLILTFFTEVVSLNRDVHLPILYDFWESLLFGKVKYKGNPMFKHIELHRKKSLKTIHFNRWLNLWEQSVHQNFEGPIAEKAIDKAKELGILMQLKIKQASEKG